MMHRHLAVLMAGLIACLLLSGQAWAGMGVSGTSELSLPLLGEAVAGQYSAGGDSATAAYSMQAPMTSEQDKLLSYDQQPTGASQIYYQGSYQPWSRFSTSYPSSTPGMWVETNYGWSWYAHSPLGGWVRALLFLPRTGDVRLYEIYPSGITQSSSFGVIPSGYRYIWFYGDLPGTHMIVFAVNDLPSNAVMIDVGSYASGSTGYGSSIGSSYGSSYSSSYGSFSSGTTTSISRSTSVVYTSDSDETSGE
ncbi:MAG: hypothetical protein JW986_01845 [Methanotrichaceae archaeon]|nr:hypothetical protein [Methanotrichaceae archaeon]